jgi:DNA polymerase III delta prime subunit|tara:strand:- start:1144 stop:2382 length:1239 start_codon:yes stop_codon:yes gene_type:complete
MWLNKYKPEILDEFVGNRNIVYRLNKWYKEDEGNIVIINGQTGIGKTLLSELFLKENNFTINTFSNCEEKSINIIKEKVEKILNFQSILEIMNNKKVAIILKDIDSILLDIIKIIVSSSIKRKVFIITNSNIKKIIQNNKKVLLLSLQKPIFKDIENLILKISLEHKFYLDDDSLQNLYEHSNGDIRFIIKFLEDLYYNIKIKSTNEINSSKFITVSNKMINNLINIQKKDIDYSLSELVNKLLFSKNTIDETLKYAHNDIYFLPTIVYDNLYILLDSKDGLSYYYECLKNIAISEYLNIKEFECQTNVSNDIQLILNTHLPNIYLNLNSKKTTVKYSVLMNKLLKYNNLKKYYNYIELKIPKQIKINYFHEIIKFSKYLDERKNTDKIIKIKDYFEKQDIDFKKLSKYFNI